MTWHRNKGARKGGNRPLGDYDRTPQAVSDESDLTGDRGIHELEIPRESQADVRPLGTTAIIPVESRALTGYGIKHGNIDTTSNSPIYSE